jgi:P-type Ca2+ transporter type 2C
LEPRPTDAPAQTAWHTQSSEAAARALAVDPSRGLTAADVAERTERYPPNALQEKTQRNPLRMLLDQFSDFMIVVLIVAAAISGVIGDVKDTLAILVIVVLNAVIGFVQEFRAERAMAALKRLAAPLANVIRDGQRNTIPTVQLLPGDVVVLEAGNVVPADLRLCETVQLKVNESALTGESLTIEKQHAALDDAAASLGDRINMAYKGTTVTYGRGSGIVVATGMATELGQIAALLKEAAEPKTPLQKRLAAFGQRLALAVLAICAIIFVAGILRGEALLLMILTAVSLAVAAIPEALPAVVTILLALGAAKMVRRHALIRRLPAMETLGSVTYICSDKTGTLTQNRMRVEEIFAGGAVLRTWRAGAGLEPTRKLLEAIALNNDADRNSDGELRGDPTETALYTAALDAGCDKALLQAARPRILEFPFDSKRKRMTTLHDADGSIIAYTKGAPELVLPRCSRTLGARGLQPFALDAASNAAERMAAEGLRVLAVAERRWSRLPEPAQSDEMESELTFLGLVGLLDPPRDEARAAVADCQSAGVRVVMITGDHPATATAVARRIGIVSVGDGGIVTGAELARMSEAEFERVVADVRVYARVDPAQKIRIVEALQAKGEFVAMTGDGVNDAPALKRADIGVAMGRGGTDVAREASSLVLLDDNFATIVNAVREGRRIFDNIRKFIKFAMSGNSGEIWTIFLAPFLGLPMPLLPIHILWINLVTDGLPGLALAAEPAERGIMQRPPRPPRESVFAHGMWQHIVWAGLLIAAVSLFAQAYAYENGSAHWQTMVFTVLTLSQMAHVLAIRSETDSLFKQGILSNMPLLGAVALTFALQLATIYVPVLNDVFRTAPLTAGELGLCLALSSVVFVAVEAEKWLRRRGWLYREPTSR